MRAMLVERPVCTCENCGTDMYEEDYFWWVGDEKFCEECAKDWFKEQRQTLTR